MRPVKRTSIGLVLGAVLCALALAVPAGAESGSISVTGGLTLDDSATS